MKKQTVLEETVESAKKRFERLMMARLSTVKHQELTSRKELVESLNKKKFGENDKEEQDGKRKISVHSPDSKTQQTGVEFKPRRKGIPKPKPSTVRRTKKEKFDTTRSPIEEQGEPSAIRTTGEQTFRYLMNKKVKQTSSGTNLKSSISDDLKKDMLDDLYDDLQYFEVLLFFFF